MTPDLTRSVLIVTAVGLALYDVVARVFGGNGCTISVVLHDAAGAWPVVAFAAGILMGHLFWDVK